MRNSLIRLLPPILYVNQFAYKKRIPAEVEKRGKMAGIYEGISFTALRGLYYILEDIHNP